jgi:hypothetical protein
LMKLQMIKSATPVKQNQGSNARQKNLLLFSEGEYPLFNSLNPSKY